MSKQYTNYNQYSNSNKHTNVVENTEASVTPDETTAPVATPDPEPTPAVHGVVSNCKKLNVRTDPDKAAEVICVINAGDEVVVCKLDGNDEWFEVHSIEGEPGSVGFHGFCMKEYIAIKQ